MLDGGEENSIIGKTDMEIQQSPELGRKFYEDDKEIMRTGKMMHCYCEFNDNGRIVYREVAKNPVYRDGKLIGVCGVVSDVTELMSLKKKFESLSFFDNLTGMYNRNYFLQYDFNKNVCLPCAYIMCDCNDLKEVNDRLGHKAGDIYIKETAAILKSVLPENGIGVRWGGDEFLLILPQCDEDGCEKLIEEIEERQSTRKKEIPYMELAVGSKIRTDLMQDEQKIIEEADQKMYEDKKRKKAMEWR